nr:uncharacterized protein LOC113819690 [Penaeus vannamei]
MFQDEPLNAVYGVNAPKKSTTYRWISRFRSRKNKVEGEPHSGRPTMSAREGNIDAVRDLIEKDRRITTESAVAPDQQQTRAGLSMEFLSNIYVYCSFLRRIVTGDVTWLYQYDPEDKIHSKQRQPRGRSGPAKAKSEHSRGKVMATAFRDAEGILPVDPREQKDNYIFEGVKRAALTWFRSQDPQFLQKYIDLNGAYAEK